MSQRNRSALNPQQRSLVYATVVSLALTLIPFGRFVLFPIQYLNTHFHEAMHAFATLASGGLVRKIEVYGDTSGVTLSQGGSLFLIAPAGYLGATLLGAFVIASCMNGEAASKIARGLAIALMVVIVLWLRGDLVGLLTAFAWLAILWNIPKIAEVETRMFAVQFVGVQLCLTSLASFRDLVLLSAQTEAATDAKNMEMATGIPAIAWATVWLILGGIGLIIGLRRVLAPRR